MPRVARAEAGKNRETIERVSSRLFREHGLRTSVDDVMNAAGLTHGGFYGHFRSKDDLVATACAAAFAESAERWRRRIEQAGDREAAHAALVENYLTPDNRASPGTSCPIPALANDVGRERQNKPVRKIFHDGLERLIELLASVQGGASKAARKRALTEISTLVGAMVLARATSGQELSDEIMDAVKESLAGAQGP